MIKNCLIVDDLHPVIVTLLEDQGVEVCYDKTLSREQIKELLPDYEGLLVRSKTKVDADLLASANKLKVIGRAGAGLDEIDQDLVASKGIQLFHAAEGNMTAVGEHAVGMLLMLMNNMQRADSQVRNREWKREFNRGYEIEGKTVGVIGYGNMGKAFAKRLSGFSCNVIAYDKFKEYYGDEYATQVSLEELFEQVDIVSLHVPLNDSSREMVCQEFWDSFRKSIWLVNTARGKVLINESLVSALDRGIVRGAALDVLQNEKFDTFTEKESLIFEELKSRDNVIFTPHVGGWTFESLQKISEVLASKIIEFYKEN